MTELLITGIIGLISTIVSGSLSWTLARRKYNSEVDNNLIENMEKSLEFYRRLSDDNRARLEETIQRNQALEREVQELKNQMLNLAVNICTDLTCDHRKRKNKPLIKSVLYVEKKDRLDETKDSCRRKCETSGEE